MGLCRSNFQFELALPCFLRWSKWADLCLPTRSQLNLSNQSISQSSQLGLLQSVLLSPNNCLRNESSDDIFFSWFVCLFVCLVLQIYFFFRINKLIFADFNRLWSCYKIVLDHIGRSVLLSIVGWERVRIRKKISLFKR